MKKYNLEWLSKLADDMVTERNVLVERLNSEGLLVIREKVLSHHRGIMYKFMELSGDSDLACQLYRQNIFAEKEILQNFVFLENPHCAATMLLNKELMRDLWVIANRRVVDMPVADIKNYYQRFETVVKQWADSKAITLGYDLLF